MPVGLLQFLCEAQTAVTAATGAPVGVKRRRRYANRPPSFLCEVQTAANAAIGIPMGVKWLLQFPCEAQTATGVRQSTVL